MPGLRLPRNLASAGPVFFVLLVRVGTVFAVLRVRKARLGRQCQLQVPLPGAMDGTKWVEPSGRRGAGRAPLGGQRVDPTPNPGRLPQLADRRGRRKGRAEVIYGEPETARFLTAVQRLKQQLRRRERQARLAKQRVRALLRKSRSS